MQKISTSTFKSNPDYYFKLVKSKSEIFVISDGKNDEAICLIPEKEFNSLKETCYLFGKEANAKRLFESIRQLKNDQTIQI